MSEHFLAKLNCERPEHRLPGTWKPFLVSENKASASFTCPLCGTYGVLQDHTIFKDGRVEPSVVCPRAEEGCSFHAIVTLDGWLDAQKELHRIADSSFKGFHGPIRTPPEHP